MSNEDPDYTPPAPPKDEKLCRRCGKWKTLSEFYRRGTTSKYLAGYCKECHSKPFETEKIRCPHCGERITFFGVNRKGEVIKQTGGIISKLKQEIRKQGKKKSKKRLVESSEKQEKDLKDIFK